MLRWLSPASLPLAAQPDYAPQPDGLIAAVPNEPKSCVELLQQMIGFDSVTPRSSGRADAEGPLGDWLAELAAAWGFDVQKLPVEDAAANVLVTHQVDPELPWLLFDSHLDTVGVDQMTIPPFEAQLQDGRLYGRGACDTKGTGAAMLWAMKQTAHQNAAAQNLALLFSVGEEARQVGARAFLQHDLPRLDWHPQAVIVGEPTQMQVVKAANGYVRFDLVTFGRAAHSSKPERGHNAISDMARAITAVEEKYIAPLAATHPLTGRSTCSINLVQGGSEHNVVPQRCRVTIDHRLTPGQDAQQCLNQVEQVLQSLSESRQEFRFAFEQIESAPPMPADDNQAAVAWACQALRNSEIESASQGAPYTTNANHFAAQGLAAVVLGPGDIAQAHTPDEWISLDQLQLGVHGYQALMCQMAT